MRRHLKTLVSIASIEYRNGTPWAEFPKNKGFLQKIEAWFTGLKSHDSFSKDERAAMKELLNHLETLIDARKIKNNQYPTINFNKDEIERLIKLLRNAHEKFGGSETDVLPIDADIPRPFTGEDFLRSIEANAEMMRTSDYVETMLMRVKTLLSDAKLQPVICPEETVKLEN